MVPFMLEKYLISVRICIELKDNVWKTIYQTVKNTYQTQQGAFHILFSVCTVSVCTGEQNYIHLFSLAKKLKFKKIKQTNISRLVKLKPVSHRFIFIYVYPKALYLLF